jgi:hypothetical protein
MNLVKKYYSLHLPLQSNHELQREKMAPYNVCGEKHTLHGKTTYCGGGTEGRNMKGRQKMINTINLPEIVMRGSIKILI